MSRYQDEARTAAKWVASHASQYPDKNGKPIQLGVFVHYSPYPNEEEERGQDSAWNENRWGMVTGYLNDAIRVQPIRLPDRERPLFDNDWFCDSTRLEVIE